MSRPKPIRAHLIAGGYPPGSFAGHDMNYARMRILSMLAENARIWTTVANDFEDILKWLPGTQLLVTYTAGPFPNDDQDRAIREWIEAGGRWLGLHGTSGGKAARVGNHRRKMVKGNYHRTLGCFFLNHPPLRKFRVDIATREHPLTQGLASSFETMDELYLIELQEPASTEILLTTELAKDPSPDGFGFAYDADTSLLPDLKTRVIGYTRQMGRGGVTYFALGHCHAPESNVQPFVDASIDQSGKTPLTFHGSWENPSFEQLVRNAIEWGVSSS